MKKPKRKILRKSLKAKFTYQTESGNVTFKTWSTAKFWADQHNWPVHPSY